jgi:flagellar biosynthesis/type III secretory pathway M-ring protein FliF/YscJ
MDLLKAQLDRIQKQLGGLSATQKMLTAALTAIMVITVVWWGRYAGEAEMVPLLNQSFTASDLGRIQGRLDEKGIKFTTSADKLLVPADRRMEILSDLTYSRLMPHSTQEGFDSMLKQMSPFDPEDKQAKLWNHSKEMLLAQIIGSFPDVVQADVMIDPKSVPRIGEGSIEPSATVNISLRDGVKPSQRLVDAAAEAVAGAEAGINTNRIKVVINGMAQKVHDADNPMDGSDQLGLLQQHEASAEERVRKTYSDIPGLLVSVTMKLNTTTIHTEKKDYDAKGTVQKVISSTSETDQTTGASQPGGEAGTMANVGLSAGGGGGGSGGGQTHEKTDEKMTVMVPETHTVSSTPAGDATPIGAAVRVPLSYFARMMQAMNGSTSEPSYAQLRPLIDDELKKMRLTVATDVGLKTAEEVSIDTYVDVSPSLASAPVAAASGFGVSHVVGGHAKEIALGALAVMSLFMASMMVRKASPSPLLAATAAAAGSGAGASQGDRKTMLTAGEALAGEASGGDSMLDGVELNDETVRTSHMVDQVSHMVRENPDAAAALVKRWLSRT